MVSVSPPRCDGERCSLDPNAEVCSIFRVSDVRLSLALLRDGDGDSSPNWLGTEAGQGPYRAAWEIPLLSKEAGSGASIAERPFATATGERPNAIRLGSSPPCGEPYGDVGPLYGVSMVGKPLSILDCRPIP